MITRLLPIWPKYESWIHAQGDAQLTMILLILAGIVALSALLLPPQLKPLAIAYVVFP